MAVKLPSLETSERPTARPVGGIASYRGPTGTETVVGEATVQAGESTRQIGGMLGREADAMFAMVRAEQEKADTTRVEDVWNKYKNAALEVTMGEQGVLKTKGGEAVNGNLLQSTPQRLKEARDRIAGDLSEEQKRRFKPRADATDLQVKHQVLSHLEAEHKEYAKTTMMGSEAAAKAQITAMPTSPEVFAQARDTLMAQADAYLKLQGLSPTRDKEAVDAYKAKIIDGLWTARIDALVYNQPMLAEAMLRANASEIKNPELRILLQHKTREAALSVQAGIETTRIVDEVRQTVPPASPRSGGSFQEVVGSLLQREGGYVAEDGKSKAPANFGINQKANPDIDVKNLTRARAIELYKSRYWDKIDGDKLAPATALVALDTAALQGVEVAKRLIDDTGGDPQAMIAVRREQLQALAAKDPEHKKQLAGWMTRLDGLAAEASQLPDMVTRQVSQADPFTQNTNGLPNSRDVAAQLPRMMLRVEETATRIYGPDVTNPDRAALVKRLTSEIHAKVAADVQQLNAIQRQAQGTLIDAVAGVSAAGGGLMPTGGAGGRGGAPGVPITSFSQIQADQKLMQAWQMMDPQAKVAIERLLEHNQRAADKGDLALFREMFNRIHLPPEDPNKVNFYQQIVDPKIADRLSMQQIQQLRLEIDRNETPGGRSLTQMRKGADTQVAAWFKTNIMFTAQPERQIAATMRWNEDVGKKVDEYVKAGKDVRSLFTLDTSDSVVNAKYLQTYVDSTPAQGLAQAAAAAKAGEVVLPPIEQPKAIDTRAKLDAWFQTLPPNQTTFLGTDGKVRVIPRRAKPPASVPPAPAAAAIMDEQGKMVTPFTTDEIQRTRMRSRFAPWNQ